MKNNIVQFPKHPIPKLKPKDNEFSLIADFLKLDRIENESDRAVEFADWCYKVRTFDKNRNLNL